MDFSGFFSLENHRFQPNVSIFSFPFSIVVRIINKSFIFTFLFHIYIPEVPVYTNQYPPKESLLIFPLPPSLLPRPVMCIFQSLWMSLAHKLHLFNCCKQDYRSSYPSLLILQHPMESREIHRVYTIWVVLMGLIMKRP